MIPAQDRRASPIGVFGYARRRADEDARGTRFRKLYAMLGLRAAIHADGTLEITVGATGEATKGVMPCDESDSPSTTFTPT